MADLTQWEYRVQTLGSTLHEVKDKEMYAMLNSWGQDGWELVNAVYIGGNKVKLVARRQLTSDERRRRSYPS
jgi:hypothetical protein